VDALLVEISTRPYNSRFYGSDLVHEEDMRWIVLCCTACEVVMPLFRSDVQLQDSAAG